MPVYKGDYQGGVKGRRNPILYKGFKINIYMTEHIGDKGNMFIAEINTDDDNFLYHAKSMFEDFAIKSIKEQIDDVLKQLERNR